MVESGSSPETVPARAGNGRGLLIYLLVSFGLAWLLELGPVRVLGYRSGNPLVMLPMVLVMFCPLVAALIARKVEGSGLSDAGLRWGKWRYHVVAWLLPMGLAALASTLTIALGLGQWDPTGSTILGKLAQANPAAAQRAADMAKTLGGWLPVVAVVQGLSFGVVMTSIATFGEEFGWRGYLQVRLERYGVLQSCLLTGLIWGVWHVPIVAQGHNYPGYPVAGSLLFIGFCTCLSVILGWLRNASGSVLAPTIAHASLNSPAAALMVFVPTNVLVGNLIGVVGIALMAALCVFLIATGRLQPRVDEEFLRQSSPEPLPHSETTDP